MLFITGKSNNNRVEGEDDSVEVQETRSKQKHDKGKYKACFFVMFIHI